MKDNFSDKSDLYKQFRPEYPKELFEYLFKLLPNFNTAWDCGTGTGQIVKVLSPKFKQVFATDISKQQIDNAEKQHNIYYSVQSAEHTNFQENSFDLITVGQAVHWFNFEKFYKEVSRTIKKEGILAILGYGKLSIDLATDKIIAYLYRDILGKYWDKERRFVDENYQTIPFLFEEIPFPDFENKVFWSLEKLLGYLNTWSAVKHYQKSHQKNPIEFIENDLKEIWHNLEQKEVVFPILSRVGRIKNN